MSKVGTFLKKTLLSCYHAAEEEGHVKNIENLTKFIAKNGIELADKFANIDNKHFAEMTVKLANIAIEKGFAELDEYLDAQAAQLQTMGESA